MSGFLAAQRVNECINALTQWVVDAAADTVDKEAQGSPWVAVCVYVYVCVCRDHTQSEKRRRVGEINGRGKVKRRRYGPEDTTG